MTDRYHARPLAIGRIDQAFPLIQAVRPALTLEDWRRFAVALSAIGADRAGIMTAQATGYLHGLFSYTVEPHIMHRRVLSVDNFVAIELLDAGAVVETLLDAIDRLAGDLRCSAVCTTLSAAGHLSTAIRADLIERFHARGYGDQPLVFCRVSTESGSGGLEPATTAGIGRVVQFSAGGA